MAKIEDIEISKLIPNPLNVKKHPKEQINDLAIQIQQEPGFTNPLIIDEDFMIWVGHGRLEAVKSIGWDKIPCIMVHNMSEAEKYRYMIKDNQVNESPWDKEKLQIAYDKVDPILFEPFQMDVQDIGVKMPIEEEAEPVPEPPEEPKAKLGDIYQLGKHRVMCGDSTKDLDKLLDTEIDLLLTDPPYGVDIADKNKFLNDLARADGYQANRIERTLTNDNIKDYDEFFTAFLSPIPFKEKSSAYIFMSDQYMRELLNALHSLKFNLGSLLVWVKNGASFGRKDYKSKHEAIVYCWKNTHDFYADYATTVIEADRPIRNVEHPTMKPIETLIPLLENSTKKDDLVYDPFLGSGSTLIACEQTNRICYGMELDPGYIDVIIERWENYTGQKAIKLPLENNIVEV